MTRDEVEKVLLKIVEDVKRAPLPKDLVVGPDANLREALTLDSLDMLEIVDELEKRLAISLDLEAIRKMTTAREIVTMVVDKVAEKNASRVDG